MTGFTLQYTDAARAQMDALPYEALNRVQATMEKICRDHDPMQIGFAVPGAESRRVYTVPPARVVAWVTRIPHARIYLLTVVEVMAPDTPTHLPAASAPAAPTESQPVPVLV